ncbi:uncharacterized protein BYT42DRAFT_583348, partial [Radiomyces spectabilis]|uniref:uncharacterized protein n=1 Tax=Radiomyces spectabilis TaxID=64574 RepID=UPI00221ECF7D
MSRKDDASSIHSFFSSSHSYFLFRKTIYRDIYFHCFFHYICSNHLSSCAPKSFFFCRQQR